MKELQGLKNDKEQESLLELVGRMELMLSQWESDKAKWHANKLQDEMEKIKDLELAE